MSEQLARDDGLEGFVAGAARELVDACTRCGACVEVCPVAPHAGVADKDPVATVKGLLTALDGSGPLRGDAAAWANQCDGCGACIPACPEAINPRSMMMLAHTRTAADEAVTPLMFRKMSRAIRLMAAMQLVPQDYQRLMRHAPPRPADVIFYTGCNAVRTPHLLFNAMYVLDALELDYEVMGGPASCCGIIHAKWEGELGQGGTVTQKTLDRFGEFTPERVLSWCPSCQLHIGETLEGFHETSFGFDHVTQFLVERIDDLAAKMTTPVPLRVLLHAHDGMADLGENVARLLAAVPGLEVAEIAWESGYTCGGSGADRSPGLKAIRREATLVRARQPDIDAVVTLYHGCHIQFASLAESEGIATISFTDLLVRALGGEPRGDALVGWRMAGDWQGLVAASQGALAANAIDADPAFLAELLPDILAQAEFRGGLDELIAGDGTRRAPERR